MKNLILIPIFSLFAFTTSAQQATEIDSKSMKLPRYVNEAAVTTAIPTPTQGMLIFRNDTKSNWYFDGFTWKDMQNAGGVVAPLSLASNSNTTITGTSSAAGESGIKGVSNNGVVGFGVWGLANASSPSATTYGVYGQNNSTNANGVGVGGIHNGTGWGGYFGGTNALKTFGKTYLDGAVSVTNSNFLEFGKGIAKQEDNGKIAYNAFGEANTLSIVGGGVATDGSDRKIKLWANGGTEFTGSITTAGEIKPNGVSGLPNQVLKSTGNGSMQWVSQTSNTTEELADHGTWGDCSSNNITGYQPVVIEGPLSTGKNFGKSVAIHGNTAIIAEYYNQGKIHIYNFESSWNLVQTIDAPIGATLFGASVAFDGQYIIVGAPFPAQISSSNTIVSYEFVYVYTFNGTIWVLSQTLSAPDLHYGDYFGGSVAISGDYFVVGAKFGEPTSTINNRGCAYIFKKTAGVFALQQKIGTTLYVDFDEFPQFGISVAMAGQTILIGSPYIGNGNSGFVEKFITTGSTWAWTSNISNYPYNSTDLTGRSLAMSGVNTAIGVPGYYDMVANRGKVMINANGTSGINEQDIICPLNIADTGFGEAIAMDGNLLIIGASKLKKAFIYQKLGRRWNLMQEVTDPITDGDFGYSVGISSTNKRFIVGSPRYRIANLDADGKATFGKLK